MCIDVYREYNNVQTLLPPPTCLANRPTHPTPSTLKSKPSSPRTTLQPNVAFNVVPGVVATRVPTIAVLPIAVLLLSLLARRTALGLLTRVATSLDGRVVVRKTMEPAVLLPSHSVTTGLLGVIIVPTLPSTTATNLAGRLVAPQTTVPTVLLPNPFVTRGLAVATVPSAQTTPAIKMDGRHVAKAMTTATAALLSSPSVMLILLSSVFRTALTSGRETSTSTTTAQRTATPEEATVRMLPTRIATSVGGLFVASTTVDWIALLLSLPVRSKRVRRGFHMTLGVFEMITTE